MDSRTKLELLLQFNKNYFTKLPSLAFLLLFCLNAASAQNRFQGQPIAPEYYEDALAPYFINYQLFHFDSKAIADYVHHPDYDDQLTLVFGDEFSWDMTLYKKSMRSDKCQSIEFDGHKQKVSAMNIPVNTFVGNTNDSHSSLIALSISKGFMLGAMQTNNGTLYIEPLNKVIDGAGSDHFIVYRPEDVIDQNATCASNAVAVQAENGVEMRLDECYEVELAIAYDLGMFNRYSTVAATENYAEAIWNLVNNDYTGWFNDDVEFVIVTHFVVTGNNPASWTTGVDGEELLSDFATWSNANGFGTLDYDLGQIWTTRNIEANGLSGVVGIAYLGVVCTNSRYQIIEDIQSSSNTMRQLVTHETGHNFNASHDGSGSGFIMAPSVNGSSTWSAASINSISAHIASRACLEDCKCMQIISVEVSQCDEANGTYTLTVTINHGQTLGSSGTITADGTVMNFNFTASPQILNITGLTSNGTVGAALLLETGSDPDCDVNQTYNAPFSTCTCDVIYSQDFNSCSQPAGWTNVALGTNTTTGIWAFGSGTLGQNSLSGNFDGTCLVFFDNDAINDDGTGSYDNNGTDVMELTSPPIDLTNYDNIILEFDYNFWTSTGADQFKVDVWDGAVWQNVLQLNTTLCGQFGCDFPHFYQVVDGFKNSAFQVRFTYTDANTWEWYVGVDNFTVCGNLEAILPIELADFNATANECDVKVDWTTASETNNKAFHLQRSVDGRNFETITQIEGNGDERDEQNYEYTDTPAAYLTYYRLMQVDFDGTSSYSKVVSVKTEDCGSVVNIAGIFPNPVNDQLTCQVFAVEDTEMVLELVDALGAKVRSTRHAVQTGENNIKVVTKDLPSGVYFLRLTGKNSHSVIDKFVKN